MTNKQMVEIILKYQRFLLNEMLDCAKIGDPEQFNLKDMVLLCR